MADRLEFGLYGLLRGDVAPGTLARRGAAGRTGRVAGQAPIGQI